MVLRMTPLFFHAKTPLSFVYILYLFTFIFMKHNTIILSCNQISNISTMNQCIKYILISISWLLRMQVIFYAHFLLNPLPKVSIATRQYWEYYVWVFSVLVFYRWMAIWIKDPSTQLNDALETILFNLSKIILILCDKNIEGQMSKSVK